MRRGTRVLMSKQCLCMNMMVVVVVVVVLVISIRAASTACTGNTACASSFNGALLVVVVQVNRTRMARA